MHFDYSSIPILLGILGLLNYARKGFKAFVEFRDEYRGTMQEHDAMWFKHAEREEIDPALFRPERAKVADV